MVANCHCCSGTESPGAKLQRRMERVEETGQGAAVQRTGELYRIPMVDQPGDADLTSTYETTFRLPCRHGGLPSRPTARRAGLAKGSTSRL